MDHMTRPTTLTRQADTTRRDRIAALVAASVAAVIAVIAVIAVGAFAGVRGGSSDDGAKADPAPAADAAVAVRGSDTRLVGTESKPITAEAWQSFLGQIPAGVSESTARVAGTQACLVLGGAGSETVAVRYVVAAGVPTSYAAGVLDAAKARLCP